MNYKEHSIKTKRIYVSITKENFEKFEVNTTTLQKLFKTGGIDGLEIT